MRAAIAAAKASSAAKPARSAPPATARGWTLDQSMRSLSAMRMQFITRTCRNLLRAQSAYTDDLDTPRHLATSQTLKNL